MSSSRPTKTTKNNISSLLIMNTLEIKFKTAYWSNKIMCVDYHPFVLVLLRKGTALHKTCNNFNTTYTTNLCSSYSSQCGPWTKVPKNNMLSHEPVPLLKKWDEDSREEHQHRCCAWKTLSVSVDCNSHVTPKSVYHILVVKTPKNYTSLNLHETLDKLCNMFKNIISSNCQGTKSAEFTDRKKLMNNACHGCQKRSQKYFPKLQPIT